jgi:hypothetical protein
MFDKIITTNTTETREDNSSHIIELLEEILIRLDQLEDTQISIPEYQDEKEDV